MIEPIWSSRGVNLKKQNRAGEGKQDKDGADTLQGAGQVGWEKIETEAEQEPRQVTRQMGRQKQEHEIGAGNQKTIWWEQWKHIQLKYTYTNKKQLEIIRN